MGGPYTVAHARLELAKAVAESVIAQHAPDVLTAIVTTTVRVTTAMANYEDAVLVEAVRDVRVEQLDAMRQYIDQLMGDTTEEQALLALGDVLRWVKEERRRDYLRRD